MPGKMIVDDIALKTYGNIGSHPQLVEKNCVNMPIMKFVNYFWSVHEWS